VGGLWYSIINEKILFWRIHDKKKLHPAIKVLVIVGIVIVAILAAIGVTKIVERVIYADFYANAENEFGIPGLNEGFVPQGMDYVEETEQMLMVGYMSNGKAGRIYRRDMKTGKVSCIEMKEEDGSDYLGHTGGIACYGDYVCVTGDDGLDIFHAEDVLTGDSEAVKVGAVKTYNNPAWCHVYEDESGVYILTGSFYREGSVYETPAEHHLTTPAGDKNTSLVTVFRMNTDMPLHVDPTPICAISTPDQMQGLCITDDGDIAVSTSWGTASSYIHLYDGAKVKASGAADTLEVTDGVTLPLFYLDSDSKTETVTAPPMSEEIECIDGRLFIFNESACNKYVFGKFLSGYWLYSYDLGANKE
jgi:hypothetical protein